MAKDWHPAEEKMILKCWLRMQIGRYVEMGLLRKAGNQKAKNS
jgi:hypothetical protein